MKIFKYILLLSFTSLPCLSLGQTKDTTSTLSRLDSIKVKYFSIDKIDTTLTPYVNAHEIDTNTYNFQHYDPLKKSIFFNSNTGNTGVPAASMVFIPNNYCGFSYGLKTWDAYAFSKDNIKHYYSLRPFTDLQYVLGMKREQLFRVTHYHHVKNMVHMGVDYRIINSPGRDNYYQKINDHTLSVFTYYWTKNKRYGVFVDYIFNRTKAQENGGITDDTAYLNYRKNGQSGLFDIYLRGAENKWKESTVILKQYVNITGDSGYRKNDSTRIRKPFNAGRFTHTFEFSKQTLLYQDNNPNLAYYPLIPNDTTTVNDSVWFFKIENTLGWTNTETNSKNKTRILRYFININHSYTEIRQLNGSFYLVNLKPSAGISLKPFKNFLIETSGEYIAMGDYQNSFNVKGLGAYQFNLSGKYYGTLKADVSYTETNAPWFYEHFYSKYYHWDYDFLKQKILSAGLNYSYRNLGAGINYYNLFNYVYLDENARPRQYLNSGINVVSAFVNKLFIFWKFGIDNKVLFQYTDEPNIMRLPMLAAYQSYYFITPMFKKALLLHVGIDLQYNTKYYADAYEPALMSFHLQNERKVGNYLNMDVFLNLKAKRLRIFLKLSNLLSGWIGYDNFTVPHYPMSDRLFRFGVSWLFHD
ncbi:MAG: putative porin [Bacteroidales bacterium]|jgi:hypothetical protein|nr:putative porin [Bacteroidales bacterium]